MRLIDADALDSVVLRLNTEEDVQITRSEYKLIDSVIFEFPTIDAVPVRHGKWTADETLYTQGMAVCSCCKAEYYRDDLYMVGNGAQGERKEE